jgi:hypothetical protein
MPGPDRQRSSLGALDRIGGVAEHLLIRIRRSSLVGLRAKPATQLDIFPALQCDHLAVTIDELPLPRLFSTRSAYVAAGAVLVY